VGEKLLDWPPESFVRHVLSKHPVPTNPETGEAAYAGVGGKGLQLHGAQWRIATEPLRFKQAGGGVRFGKSFIVAMLIELDFLWRTTIKNRTDDLYWLIGPDYEQAQEEMRHLHRLFDEVGVIHEFRDPIRQSWSITFPDVGTEIVTKTAADALKIAGRAPRGIAMCEASQQAKEVMDQAILRLLQTNGWLFMCGTFENAQPWYYQNAEEWEKPEATGVFYECPSWDNRVVFPGGREDPKILSAERDLPPALFMEKIGGKPQKASSLVFPEAQARYHVAHRYPYLKTSYDPEQPVYLWGDPGIRHAYAVMAVQMVGQNVTWVIDAVYRWGRDARSIIAECAGREWAKNVERVVLDVASAQRRSEGPSNQEQWMYEWPRATGQAVAVVLQPVPLHVGYEIHRRALLNSWPEHEAQKMFNSDGRIRGQVTDPEGPRIVFDPMAAGPLFGGMVDGQKYAGEYNLHKNPKRRDGQTATGEDPVDADNDAIKAIHYGLFHTFRVSGRARMQMPEAMDWVISA
jgi:hypothetical protein